MNEINLLRMGFIGAKRAVKSSENPGPETWPIQRKSAFCSRPIPAINAPDGAHPSMEGSSFPLLRWPAE
jgi:hypothetical protein